jgi:hypothetical protein
LPLIVGCAHISEYNQGCRDGLVENTLHDYGRVNKDWVDNYCDSLDGIHKAEQKDHTERK